MEPQGYEQAEYRVLKTARSGPLTSAAVFMLAGGEGRRLRPLTDDCPKPLVPFGGAYRIIDFTLSNALHSHVDHLYVATQYKAEQVSQYLRERWGTISKEHDDFAIPLAPQPGRPYRGTCDALLQNLNLAERDGARDAIVLSADHIYRMDYRDLLAFHRAQNADATIATTTIGQDSASQYGVNPARRRWEDHRLPGEANPRRALVRLALAVMRGQHGRLRFQDRQAAFMGRPLRCRPRPAPPAAACPTRPCSCIPVRPNAPGRGCLLDGCGHARQLLRGTPSFVKGIVSPM